MSDQESFEEKRRKWKEEKRKRRDQCRAEWNVHMGSRHTNSSSGIWTGLFILLVGVAFLLKATVTDIPHWVFTWQMLLIALGFFLAIKQIFTNGSLFAPLVLMLVGGAFLVPEIDPDITIKRYVWPVVLIIIGLYFILRHIRLSNAGRDEKKNQPNSGIEDATVIDETFDSKEDFIQATSVFGGTKKNVLSKNFRGGNLVSIFGGTEVDLTRADFNGTAIIDLTTIFGGTKLVVPSHWEVKSEAAVIFGGVEDKRTMTASPEGAPKRLVLKGTILFGGIDIKSY
ncbi:MAG: hypothetical protein HOP10_05585 [Chitinophagaceae bacterium]|nr:hypothetical protein [Chitinophagaceae bacterium]